MARTKNLFASVASKRMTKILPTAVCACFLFIKVSESILIVDDERGIRDTLRGVMGDEGFVADAVASGEECLKALERRTYDCILLDVWLPGIDGLETLQQFRASWFGLRRRNYLRTWECGDRRARHQARRV